jgi:hypothetical protein
VDGRTAAPTDTAGRQHRRIQQDGGEDGYGSMAARMDGRRTDCARDLGIGELGINRINHWCVQGLRAKGMEGIGVREMGSPESPSGLFPGRIGSTATEQGLSGVSCKIRPLYFRYRAKSIE